MYLLALPGEPVPLVFKTVTRGPIETGETGIVFDAAGLVILDQPMHILVAQNEIPVGFVGRHKGKDVKQIVVDFLPFPHLPEAAPALAFHVDPERPFPGRSRHQVRKWCCIAHGEGNLVVPIAEFTCH